MLTAGTHFVGHYQLWKRSFAKFQISLYANLIRHLKEKDRTKERRQVVQKTNAYKSTPRTNQYAKFAEAHRSQLEENKTGAKYESGVAVKEDKKTLKLAPKRNPKGTLPSDWKCPFFHPKFCNTTYWTPQLQIGELSYV